MSEEKRKYIPFTEEMKRDYTILVPNMLPMHFKLIMQVLKGYGYKMELLETSGPEIAETGLKYVHNDTCYPAILVIGQFISALQSGRYDPDKVALILFQTGGGCRASNYIFLLRKALARAGYSHVPVISLNFSGLESHPGFKLTLPIVHRMFYAVVYGDLLLSLVNQVKPHELEAGAAERLSEKLCASLAEDMQHGGTSFKRVKQNCKMVLNRFAEIPVNKTQKVKVGVVGEIYVKYSPLGNNNLEQFLVDEGAEVVVPGLMDFCLYTTVSMMSDYTLYGMKPITALIGFAAYKLLSGIQNRIIKIVKEHGAFEPATPISHTLALIKEHMSVGTKMGEGWLLPAEMLELNDTGVHNIVCTQPFGCLPNHICGKGMMKPLKDAHPEMNIVAIDYDAGATKVNQENRIKLMLANAKEALENTAAEQEAGECEKVAAAEL